MLTPIWLKSCYYFFNAIFSSCHKIQPHSKAIRKHFTFQATEPSSCDGTWHWTHQNWVIKAQSPVLPTMGLTHPAWHQSRSQALQTLPAPAWHSARDLQSDSTECYKPLSSVVKMHLASDLCSISCACTKSTEPWGCIYNWGSCWNKKCMSQHQLGPFLSRQGLRMEPATKQAMEQTSTWDHTNRPNPTGPSTGHYYNLPALADGREKVTLTWPQQTA